MSHLWVICFKFSFLLTCVAVLGVGEGSACNSPIGIFRVQRSLANACIIADLKNRTRLSIYFWETEANGGHIGVTT